MKKLLFIIGLMAGSLFFIPVNMLAQCPNMNFSMNNFSYWQCYADTSLNGVDTIIPCSPIPGRHTIMDAQQLMLTNQLKDEQCNVIPKVPTGFNYAAKLGNAQPGAKVSGLEYTMTVDSTNSLFIFHFAWVMQNCSHHFSEEPLFSMIIKDTNGIPIPYTSFPCGHVSFNSPEFPGACISSGLIIENWRTISISLIPLMGQTIKIYFETRDCTVGDHFGYAYIATECRPMSINLMYCSGQTAARLSAPKEFLWYKWKRSSDPLWVKEGRVDSFRTIAINNVLEGEIFSCQMTSQLGASCSATIYKVIEKTTLDVDFNYGIKINNNVDLSGHHFENWYDTCNRTATFVDMSRVINSRKESVMWEVMQGRRIIAISFDSLFTYTFPDPDTNQPVDYLIRLTVYAENRCADTSKGRTDQHITIYPSPKIKIEGVNQLCAGDSTYLKAVAVRSEFIRHDWSWTDPHGITQTATGDSLKIYGPGTYTLISKDRYGCFAKDTLVVTSPKPQMPVTITDVACYGQATGAFTHGPVTGGQSPYQSFTWTLLDRNGNPYVDLNANINGSMYTNLTAGIYTFEAIDAVGCVLSGEIEIKQNDSLRISGQQTPATCGLDNGSLKLTATGGAFPYTFEIRQEDGTLVSSSDTASDLSAGIYRITVIDNVNCITSDTITVAAMEVPATYTIAGKVTCNNNPLEGVTIIYTGNSICSNDTAVTDTSGEYTIHVDSNANVTLTPNLPGYTFTPPFITCSNITSNLLNRNFIAISVGISNKTDDNTYIHIYPNPTTGQLRITNYKLRDGNIEIYDVLGRNVHLFTRPLVHSSIITIDISHLPAGIYFLKIKTEKGSITQKISKN